MASRLLVLCLLLIHLPLACGHEVCHEREETYLPGVYDPARNRIALARILDSRKYRCSYSRCKYEWQMKLRKYWKPRKKWYVNAEPSCLNCLLICKMVSEECYLAWRLSSCCVLSPFVFLATVARSIMESMLEAGSQEFLSVWEGVETSMRRAALFLHFYAAMHGSPTAVLALFCYSLNQHLSSLISCRILTLLCWCLACEEAELVWLRAIGFVCGGLAPLFPPRTVLKRATRKRPSSRQGGPTIVTSWNDREATTLQEAIDFISANARKPKRSWAGRSKANLAEDKLAKKLSLVFSSTRQFPKKRQLVSRYHELAARHETIVGNATGSQKPHSDIAGTPGRKPKRMRSGSSESEHSVHTSLPLTPASAMKLAQSCRKSPYPKKGSSELAEGGVSSSAYQGIIVDDDSLAKVSTDVSELYGHIKDECEKRQDLEYIPKSHYEQKWYKKVVAMRQHISDASTHLTADAYRVLCSIAHIFKQAEGQNFKNVFGCEVAVDDGWRWTFEPYINVSSETFKTKAEATQELTCIQRELYHAWNDKGKREAHLKSILQHITQQKALQAVSEERSRKFARLSLQQDSHGYQKAQDMARGLQNLGNTCYLNAVVQCLLHCTPFRHDMELQAVGSSYLGDRLKELWALYRQQNATRRSLHTKLAALVEQVLSHTGFLEGRQQDAAECLMYLLGAVDGGRMQERVCMAYAAATVEGMILCTASAEAQVSSEAPPVSMGNLLTGSLTDDQALREAPPALIIRVENIYEQNDVYFSVDALASWDATRLELTVMGDDSNTVVYKVSGYVAHVYHGDVDARQRMSSGHYVAYMNMDDTWYRVTL
jgi:hypothetical protein